MNWESYVRRVTPYTPGEQPKDTKIIKLNTNENPYPPAPGVDKVLKELDTDRLRKYPDPTAHLLVSAIAKYHGLKETQVFAGIGSDDVLAMLFLTFFGSDKPVLFPNITYSFYDVWAEVFRIPYVCRPLDENFKIRPEDYYEDNGGVIFANPNAPTGEYLPLEIVEDIVSHNRDQVVVVDEAYIDFGGESALPLIDRYENLLVVRTFSKSHALADLRIGYVMGNEKLIRYLNDVKYSFNSYTLNTPVILAGKAALEDEAYFQMRTRQIIATRERVKPEFRRLGFEFGDSMSNFLFVRHPKMAGTELFARLRADGILVRRFNKPELISDYLRISIGTEEEMDRLLECLKSYLEA